MSEIKFEPYFKFADKVNIRVKDSWYRGVVVQVPKEVDEPYLVVFVDSHPASSAYRNACDLRHADW